MVEHLPRVQEVGGSNPSLGPLPPTMRSAASSQARGSRVSGWLARAVQLQRWYRYVVPIRLAVAYRRQLANVRFVGITGSCGKTTTKEMLAAILGTRGRVRKNPGNDNQPHHIAPTILKLRPGDAYCVLEIGVGKRAEPQVFERSLALTRPDVAVVTNIGSDHISAFGSREAIAAQKGRLVEALGPAGVAVLNADDPLVLAMRARCAGRVLTYGICDQAAVRAEEIRGAWPAHLAFTLVYEGRRHAVQTQLCGRHWVPCVLAVLSAAIALDVPLDAALAALRTVPPFPSRMSEDVRGDGVTFVSDDIKCSFWTLAATFDFLKEARARRKVLVVGTISDYTGNSDRAYAGAAKQALAVADHVVFVGGRSAKALKAHRHADDEALQAFASLPAAFDHLDRLLQPGDLVLLKGIDRDGLGALRAVPPRRVDAGRVAHGARTGHAPVPIAGPADAMAITAVVGLGNAGEGFRDTPHNVGQAAIDRVAHALNGTWRKDGNVLVASVAVDGRTVHLLKPADAVNCAGPALRAAAQGLGIEPPACVLVHDDLDLPLGTVRHRMKGTDGGHRGVRSILEAFGTTAFQRVKIGVGRSGGARDASRLVVTKFDAEQAVLAERGCAAAAQRVLDLLRDSARA